MVKKSPALLFLIFILIIAGAVVLVFTNYNTKELPKLTITYNGKEIKSIKGSYLWKRGFKNEVHVVDSYAKIINQLRPGEQVMPDGELEINFDYQPKTIILTSSYNSERKILENNYIKLPTNIKGPMVYFLDCYWKEGVITYVVVVELKS